MRTLTATICLSLLILSAPVVGGEEERVAPEARAILEKAIESMGGDAALAGIEGMKATYEGSYGGAPFTSTVVHQPPCMVWTLDAGVFQGSMGFDGKDAWTKFQCPPARLRGEMKKSVESWMDHYDIMLIRPILHRDDVTITMGGSEGKRTVVLKFAIGQTTRLTFATEGGKTWLVSATGDMLHMDGTKGTFLWQLSEPKKYGAITMPSKLHIQTFRGGETAEDMTEELAEIEWNPKAPAETFAIPKLEMKLGEIAEKTTEPTQGLMLVHEGDYARTNDTIRKAWGVLAEAKLMNNPMAPMRVVYLVDPSTVKDPSELRAQVIIPVMIMPGMPTPKLPEGASIVDVAGAEVVSLTVKGPYGSVETDLMAKLSAWMAENGKESAGPPSVLYYHVPDGTVPEDQVAEAHFPIK